MKRKIKVLIADDHAVVRAGLATLLCTESDIEVVAQAKNGTEAISKAVSTRPDVVIMDLRMPGMDGVNATAELHRRIPETRVLVLTSFGEADGVAHALESGAVGAMTKTAEDAELVSIVRRIAAGERYVHRRHHEHHHGHQQHTPQGEPELCEAVSAHAGDQDLSRHCGGRQQRRRPELHEIRGRQKKDLGISLQCGTVRDQMETDGLATSRERDVALCNLHTAEKGIE